MRPFAEANGERSNTLVEYFALLALPTMTIPRPRNAPFALGASRRNVSTPFSEA